MYVCTASPVIRTLQSPDITAEAAVYGRSVVICGPMCSGKTEELIRLINVSKVAELNTLAFKPKKDTRSENELFSRGRPNDKIDAT